MNSIQGLNQVTKVQRRAFQNLKITPLKTYCQQSTAKVEHFAQGTNIKDNSHDEPDVCNGDNFQEFYEKVEKLGEGAHSIVHSYIQKKTRKIFAVKFLKSCDKERITQLIDTLLLNKKLSHPYVIKDEKIFINKQHSKIYLVSQMCSYNNLRNFIDKQKSQGRKIKIGVAMGIIEKLLQCLKYLKSKGVCHRDIKPENILYDTQTGNIKLIDFQIAKMKKDGQEQLDLWTPIGTLYYRAPESFSLGYSETVDMWAVGIIAFQLLTGQLPFKSRLFKGANNLNFEKCFNLRKFSLAFEVQQFLSQMLEKDPRKRFTPEKALDSIFLVRNTISKIQNQIQVSKAFQGQYCAQIAFAPQSPSMLSPESESLISLSKSKIFQAWDKFMDKDKSQQVSLHEGKLCSSISTTISLAEGQSDYNNEEELEQPCSPIIGFIQ